MTQMFSSFADAGFALLIEHREGRLNLTVKAGSFCGQLVAGTEPLTDRQAKWLGTLLARAGLPPVQQMEVA